ncbi:N-acetyltransferase family protein [Bacillus sp. AK031]
MEIRSLIAEDAEAYWELRLEALKNDGEAFATTYEESIARQDPLQGVRSNLESSGSITYGVFSDVRLAGNVTILFNRHEKMKHKASIVAMYVTPSFRKKGIGHMLLNKAEQSAKESKVEILQLTVVTTNSSAVNLYEKAGYMPFAVEKKAMKHQGQFIDEMWMSKLL